MMKCETQPFDIETKVRQDCYNRGYEQGRKNPAEEIVEYIEKLQKQVKEYQGKIEQGTLIELPCKVGDTVYAIGKKKVGQIRKCIVGDISIADSSVEVHFDCDYSCDDCHFNGWAQDYSGEWTCYGEYGDGNIPFSEFGKTVFLTREEAEKRLKELQE